MGGVVRVEGGEGMDTTRSLVRASCCTTPERHAVFLIIHESLLMNASKRMGPRQTYCDPNPICISTIAACSSHRLGPTHASATACVAESDQACSYGAARYDSHVSVQG